MKTMLPPKEPPMPLVEIIKNITSLVATCIGLVAIIIGLKYAIDIFHIIFTILKSPTYLTAPIQQMAEVIGGSAFELNWEGRAVFLANIMALGIYCCGVLLCAWLTLALMHTGAKIVSLTAGDRSAVKKLIESMSSSRREKKETRARHDIETQATSHSQP